MMIALAIAAGRDVDRERLDPVLAAALLFAVVVLPPLAGVRMMYTLCWLSFTALALLIASDAALGIATSMGITIMVGWYALRVFDRGAFQAGMNGWMGVWARSPVVGFFARLGDIMVHLLLPMVLIAMYLPLVRVWMSIPALISSRLWVHFVVGGGVFPKGDHVFRFTPPRSQHFWHAAYRIELLLNLFVPLFCVLAHQRSFWVYSATALGGIILFGLQLVRSLSITKLRRNAQTIMARLLSAGGLMADRDFVIRNNAVWLDWMRDGLIAIGETFVGGLWDVTPARTLDEFITAVMTIPMEARQEMYRSWSARVVALAARMFNYPPAAKGLVVGPASEQFDLSPQFRREYMDRYVLQSYGLWLNGAADVSAAQAQKLAAITETLELETNQHILDLSVGSWGGVAIYLAERHPTLSIMSVVTTPQERIHALRFAEEVGVAGRVEFVLAETPEKLLRTLCSISASRFDRIVGSNVVETLNPIHIPRFFRTLKRIQAPGGFSLLDVVVCGNSRSAVHVWNNTYIHGAFPVQPIMLTTVRNQFETSGFAIDDIAGFTEHFERTFMMWHERFRTRWPAPSTDAPVCNSPSSVSEGETAPPRERQQSLPESFRRTWEFHLLHSAACFRAGLLQVYRLRAS
ncbi:hypothetical protein PINS_up000080 [Pythium insidiosum]|nr:hypothetical protein PINS_up000080 [Pythium insidiosum]